MKIALPKFTGRNMDNADKLAVIYILLFLVIGVLTLRFYGLTWDESLGNLFFGERYFNFFTSFKQVDLDFKANLPIDHRYGLDLYLSPFRNVPYEFPPVADTLSAATMHIFSFVLNWLNPVDGFHLFPVILTSLFLGYFYFFSASRFGKYVAWLGLLFLSLFPRLWADMHFNVKDVPETIFFSATLMTFWLWIEKPSLIRAAFVGLLFGYALGVKANALFILPVAACVIIANLFGLVQKPTFVSYFRRYSVHYFVMGGTALAVYLVSWPYLYSNVIYNLLSYWKYIFSQGGRTSGLIWNVDPVRQVVTTMPEFMLIFLVVGMIFAGMAAWKKPSSIWFFVLLWLCTPLLRASLPGMVNFDGIRHFLEFLPAAALVAAYGVSRVAEKIVSFVPRYRAIFRGLPLLLIAVNFMWISLGYFPYLHIYYNSFVGGLSGARDRFLGLQATDYWASSYRTGMEWLKVNAAPGSRVYAMPANWILEISAPVFLGEDFKVFPEPLPDFRILESDKTPTYLFFLIRQGPHMDELAYCQSRYQPVFEVSVDSVTFLQIFKLGGT